MKKKRVILTGREKSELVGEGVVTIILLLLLNLSIIILINLAMIKNQSLVNGIYYLKSTLVFANGQHIWSWERIFIVFMGLGDLLVLYWRLIRRYHQMQLRHVIQELHYIAEGHFDHRISFVVKTDLQKVIDSINFLVDSTVNAMDEERQIEKSKDDLITNVSHDIRTPLTSIIGYLGLLKTDHSLNPNQVKYVDIAYNKAEQMKALANDLFDYTTLNSAKTKIKLVPLHLNSMLEQVAAGFELEAEAKKIDLQTKCSPIDLTIDADAEKLVRVFNNLISNAFKYGHDASFIRIAAKKLDTRKVELRVENDGEKIPASSLNKIFERFYRVETSRNTNTGGTGLGLAIVKEVVDLHHGSIRCESDDHLTSFIITFPIKTQMLPSTGTVL
ncbi:sensor histidine kinase [Lactobacillus psittaci]|uniref:histidine kinase n=1 Tax=Lactobacillus psittaci DSM 15354 TaxID=1122152 RepID=A0A0R1S9M0_9LACO|nr:HAMP domain-containing sensor histidine kinase [Lactobacillus psittaci]KRL63346.1 two-component system histidine kinase [Lactobacillus psittaci DSM 15354]